MNAPVRRMFSTTQALPAVADELPLPRLRRLMWKALTLPIAVTLLLCGLLVHQLVVVAAEAEQAARARGVIAEANRAQRLMLDQEVALRGYLIDRTDMFLAPLHIGQMMTPATLRRLGELVGDDPEQRPRVDALVDVYDRWEGASGLSPALVATTVDEASRQRLADREAQLDAVRRITRGLVETEEARLGALAAGGWLGRVWVLAAALGLGLLAASAVALRRWIRRMEGIYAKALAKRRQSEANERAARQAAEALAEEVTAQSRELQLRFRALRDELEVARAMRRAG